MKDLTDAAQAISAKLKQDNVAHAIIGSFPLALLGHTRTPNDLDVAIDKTKDIAVVRTAIKALSKFSLNAHDKLEYTGTLGPIEVETPTDGQLGFPKVSVPSMLVPVEDSNGMSLIRPEFLLLAKLKRWNAKCDTTNPVQYAALKKDATDIIFLIEYLNKKEWEGVVSFSAYYSYADNIDIKLLKISANFFLERTQESKATQGLPFKVEDKDRVLLFFRKLLVPSDLKNFDIAMEDTEIKRGRVSLVRTKWRSDIGI
ncbi:hypothetical protein H0H87_006857 [Tephrocybe sp. NHM501043]|nr:hypothetical protein H0H87_006857 [Tephrocybe sp. NHM501043]